VPDLRPSLDPAFAAFGVPATVTPAGGVPIATTVIGQADLMLTQEANADPSIVDYRRRVAVRKSDVPELPVGSTILAPAGFVLAGTPTTYTVDLTEDLDPEVHHARVHE
jgi:hypothetical protein